MQGEITYYNKTKGFGFIKGEDSKDYWFHISESNKPQPIVGDKAEFETKQTLKGPQAHNIQIEN